MQWLTLINDHDVSEPTGESRFSNVRVYEADEASGAGGLSYLHTDHLGAVVKATDESGGLVWDGERRPFGERVVAVSDVEMVLGFPGQYYDEETNNYYNYFRDYDPTTGRYLQSDPIGLWGGLNTYAYVGGNPLYWVDPFGLCFGGSCHDIPVHNPPFPILPPPGMFPVPGSERPDWWPDDIPWHDSKDGDDIFDPPMPRPADGRNTHTETDPCPPLKDPPDPRERCFNGVELRYGMCLQQGKSPTLCWVKKVAEAFMCSVMSDSD
jgi:RHS repeat-associated protein